MLFLRSVFTSTGLADWRDSSFISFLVSSVAFGGAPFLAFRLSDPFVLVGLALDSFLTKLCLRAPERELPISFDSSCATICCLDEDFFKGAGFALAAAYSGFAGAADFERAGLAAGYCFAAAYLGYFRAFDGGLSLAC